MRSGALTPWLVLALLLGMAVIPAASAHDRAGRADAVLSASVSGQGGVARVVAMVRDRDSGRPLERVRVAVQLRMTSPHVMTLMPVALVRREPGRYAARTALPMPGRWQARITVQGPKVRPAALSLPVPAAVTRTRVAGPATATAATPRVEEKITSRDAFDITILWLHALSSLGWIVGVIVMAAALASRPALLAPSAHAAVLRAYRRWGVWLHWGLVAIVVGTGVYNLMRVTPFDLVWRPGELDRLELIPYGTTYELILVVKLAFFAALLMTGTSLLWRTLAGAETRPEAEARPRRSLIRALGFPGAVFVVCVPLVVAAAAALRYVHILSHTAGGAAG